MPIKRDSKSHVPLVADRTSDAIWAAITILSLPIAAMAFSNLDFSPFLAFLLAIGVTFAVIVIETLVRGRLWIFQGRFHHAISHPDTPFRVLIVAGGILLILQTWMIIQIFQNPDMDHFMLNVILRKQCERQSGVLADKLCPVFSPVKYSNSYALRYSLENLAKQHILPTSVFGSCAIAPLGQWPTPKTTVKMDFLAYCAPWNSTNDAQTDLNRAQSALVTAELDMDVEGFYTARTWQQSQEGQKYNDLMSDKQLIGQLKDKLAKQREAIIQAYIR